MQRDENGAKELSQSSEILLRIAHTLILLQTKPYSCIFILVSLAINTWASQVAPALENLPANAGNIRDSVLIPVSGESLEEDIGHPLQYSCLKHPMDRASQATVHRVSDMTEDTTANTDTTQQIHRIRCGKSFQVLLFFMLLVGKYSSAL